MPTFDIGRLFETRPGPPSDWYYVLVALFAAVLTAGIIAYTGRRRLFSPNGLRVRVMGRFGLYAAIVGAIGLLLLAARYLGVEFFSMRFLLVLAVLALPALAAYAYFFRRRRYDALRQTYDREEQRRRYLPPVARATTATHSATGASKRRSKKRHR